MTSRLMTLLKVFRPRGVRTIDNPNSWAAVSSWRRFFDKKEGEEEKEEEEVQGNQGILEQTAGVPQRIIPVGGAATLAARKDFVLEHYRIVIAEKRQEEDRIRQQQHEAQQIHHPNCDIPAARGDAYMSLAQ